MKPYSVSSRFQLASTVTINYCNWLNQYVPRKHPNQHEIKSWAPFSVPLSRSHNLTVIWKWNTITRFQATYSRASLVVMFEMYTKTNPPINNATLLSKCSRAFFPFYSMSKPCVRTTGGHWQISVSHDLGCESPSFNTFSPPPLRGHAPHTRSIQRWGMKTGLTFWSWFNPAVTPIADALKWLRGIVSAWRDLQLSGTSAQAAAPRHPLNLQIWHAHSLVLVGGQRKQFPLQSTANNFMRWISSGQLDGFQLWISQERHCIRFNNR